MITKFHKYTNESLKDLMKPKSEEEIEYGLKKLEPLERYFTIFDAQMDSVQNEDELLYSWEEIDEMIPGFIEVLKHSHSVYDKIEILHRYYNIFIYNPKYKSVLIRQELKRELNKLPASYQTQLVHDFDYLGGLYTDKEWNDLKIKTKQEVNESLKDLMKPKSEEEITDIISQWNPNKRLVYGATEGILSIVKKAISDGADINFGKDIGKNPWTPLFYASLNNHEDVAKYLLEQGAIVDKDTMTYTYNRGNYKIVGLLKKYQQINEGIRDKMKPKSEEDIRKNINNLTLMQQFLRGVSNNIYWLVEESLKKGADVNFFNDVCIQTAALKEENIDIMRLLLEYGANVNINDDYPLRYASENGYLEMVKLLLKYGANPNAYNNYAIDMAKENGYTEIYNLLLKHSKSNESLRDKMTPKSEEELKKSLEGLTQDDLNDRLVLAVKSQYLSYMKALLDMGANPNSKKNGISALSYAVIGSITTKPNLEVIKMLLDYGADPLLSSDKGTTIPLRHAETWKKWDIVELMKKYIKVNESLRDKMKPISKEEIDDKIYKILNQYSKFGTFDWKKWGWEFSYDLIESINDDSFFFEHKNGQLLVLNLCNGIKIDFRSDVDTFSSKKIFNNYKELEEYLSITNESLRDKMKPKSKEEIKEIEKRIIYNIAKIMVDSGKYTERQALTELLSAKYYVFDKYEDGWTYEEIAKKFIRQYEEY